MGKSLRNILATFQLGLLTLCFPGCGQGRGVVGWGRAGPRGVWGWCGWNAHSLSRAELFVESSNPCPEGPLLRVSKVKTNTQLVCKTKTKTKKPSESWA